MSKSVVPRTDDGGGLGRPDKRWSGLFSSRPIFLAEQSVTPSTAPSAGNVLLYPKTDGNWYYMTSDGVETAFGGGVTPTFTNTDPTPLTVGGIGAGSTFDAQTMEQMWTRLLYPELFPSLTNPSSTFTLTQAGLREIGETVTLGFAATFSRGSISPAYGTSGLRSGLPNEYVYTGTGLTSTSTTSLSDSKSVVGYTVVTGAQNWTGRVAYDGGEQPKSSYGEDYSTPLAAGQTSAVTRTITGVYPVFATTSAIGTMTKQTLAAMNAAYVQTNMVAESGSDKQVADFPQAWSAITGIQFYNTVSGAWEWIGGGKPASLATFTVSTTTHTVQGASVNYDRFTHNGALLGARQLRWYTT